MIRHRLSLTLDRPPVVCAKEFYPGVELSWPHILLGSIRLPGHVLRLRSRILRSMMIDLCWGKVCYRESAAISENVAHTSTHAQLLDLHCVAQFETLKYASRVYRI